MSRVVNILSLLSIVVLLVMLIPATREGQRLKKDHDRLATVYGELPVEDESQYCVVFVPGENPTRQFRWRIYSPALPKGCSALVRSSGRMRTSSSGGFGPTSSHESTSKAIFRVRDGIPEFYYQFSGSSSVHGFHRDIRSYVAKFWDQFEFEVLAHHGHAVVSPSGVTSLLTIRIPESLHGQLPENLSEKMKQQYKTKPLVEMMFGDPTAMEKVQ